MADVTINRVGPSSAGDGTPVQVRLTTWGSTVVQQASGKYAEAVSRGNCYSAMTAVTGVAPGTSISTTGAITVYNRGNSGKRLSFMKSSMGYVSGTLGAGYVAYVVDKLAQTALPTGTAIVPQNLLAGASNNSSALALTTSTIVLGFQLRAMCNLSAMLATTAVTPWNVVDDIDGEIQLLPGFGLSLIGVSAAGSSPLVVFSLAWEEATMVGGI